MRWLSCWCLLWLPLVSCDQKPIDPEVFLIPEGYVGTVEVIYDVESGQPATHNASGARVFDIPASGVLHTQFKSDNQGLVTEDNRRFFYINEKGEKGQRFKSILGRIDDTPKNRKDPTLYAHFSSYGTHGFNSETNALGCKYSSDSYYIGTLQQKLNSEGTFSISDYYIENGYPCEDKLYFLDKPPVTIISK